MKKKVSILVCMLLFAAAALVAGTVNIEKNEVGPYTSSDPGPGTLDPGDILFEYHVENETGDYQCLGVEFDGTNFWVTGGNNETDPNHLYKFDDEGNLLNTYDQPGHSTGWGWRDLAYDGTYLYASVDSNVDQIDPATGQYTGETIPGPVNPNRALAYDPATDHFWTANFASLIYEFDRDGVVQNSFDNTYSIYGMAWDDFSEDGPWLWTYDQTDDGASRCNIRQFDPVDGVYTGLEYEGVFHAYPADVAGGACFYDDGEIGIFVGLTQNTPDLIFGMEISAVAEEPELEISEITGGFGVSAVIDNVGDGEATDTDWSITLDGGLIILGKETTGTIASIPAGESAEIKSGLILGIGKPTITVTAECAEGKSAEGNATGFVLLFFVIGVS